MRVSRGITQDAEFEELGRRGYEGNLNDRQYKLLGNIGLRGALTDRIGSSAISAYALAAVDDKLPPLVMDFKEEDYFSNNTIGSFAEVAEHSRAGNATMTDSSGNIVWAPHNLALNSATPATQSITVVSGVDYTVECTGVSIALSGAGTGTVTEGNPVEITASTTTLTLTVTGSSGTMWVYRSDLGGMANNPDRGDSYVPTTSSAVYLPRRGHHVYNGSQWVNKGLLHESEARTNLVTDSVNLPSTTNVTETLNSNTSPDGQSNAVLISNSAGGAAAFHYYYENITISQSTQYTLSCYAKHQAGSGWVWLLGETASDGFAFFNVSTGAIGTTTNFDSATIEDCGNGWYRLSATFTKTSATGGDQIGIGLTTGDNVKSWDSTGVANQEQVLVYGFQLEAASTPSSYIPTNGSSVTRPAESITIPAANLPWPEPVVIGEELVTNGTFDSDVSGWTTQAGDSVFTVSSGQLTISRSAFDPGYVYQIISTTAGSVYSVSFDVVDDGPIDLRVGTSPAGLQIASSGIKSSAGTYTLLFVATGITTYVSVVNTSYSVDATIDNISVKEIKPLSVSMQMDGRMTFADTNSNPEAIFWRWVDGGDYLRADLRTDSTRTGAIRFYQSLASPPTIDAVESAETAYSPDILVPFNISSRHGSTFINGAVDGVALTEDTTPVALPDLSTADLELGYDFMGTIKTFRMWADDIGDTGIEEATS